MYINTENVAIIAMKMLSINIKNEVFCITGYIEIIIHDSNIAMPTVVIIIYFPPFDFACLNILYPEIGYHHFCILIFISTSEKC